MRRAGRRRPALASAVVGLVAVATLVASCGVPLDEEPRAIDRTTTTPSTVAPAANGDDGATMSLYFFNGDRLQDQQVPADDDPTIADAITAVLGEPEPPLTTQIPAGTELLSFALEGTTAVIDLSEEVEIFTGQEQKMAYAQLTFTALASGEATEVRFLVAGAEVAAPTDQGNLDVVTADDYDPPLNPR